MLEQKAAICMVAFFISYADSIFLAICWFIVHHLLQVYPEQKTKGTLVLLQLFSAIDR